MTYDEWKLRSDRDESPPDPPPFNPCRTCGHDDDCDCPCCNEPAYWRCEGCGEVFDAPAFSHPRHDWSCEGECRYCPVECGPITKVQ